MRTPPTLNPGPYLSGIAGGALVALIGTWLVAAPFALAYQPEGAEWVDATVVSVATGGALLLVGLLVLGLLWTGLRRAVSEAGLAPPKRARPASHDEVEAAPAARSASELETLLAPLAAALLEDLRDGHRAPHPDDVLAPAGVPVDAPTAARDPGIWAARQAPHPATPTDHRPQP